MKKFTFLATMKYFLNRMSILRYFLFIVASLTCLFFVVASWNNGKSQKLDAQNAKQKKTEFEKIRTSISHHEVQPLQNFFDRIPDKDLATIVGYLAEGESKEAVAYTIMPYIYERLVNRPSIVPELLQEMEKRREQAGFVVIGIDFLSRVIKEQSDSKYWSSFEATLSRLAQAQDADPVVRQRALGTLGQFSTDTNVTVLFQALNESDSVRRGALRGIRSTMDRLTLEQRTKLIKHTKHIINDQIASPETVSQALLAMGESQHSDAESFLRDYIDSVEQIDLIGPAFLALSNFSSLNNLSDLVQRQVVIRNSQAEAPLLDDLLFTILSKHPEDVVKMAASEDREILLSGLESIRILGSAMEQRVSHAVDICQTTLSHTDPTIRLAAVRALHVLLPHEEEVVLLSAHRVDEKDEKVLAEIGKYIGYK